MLNFLHAKLKTFLTYFFHLISFYVFGFSYYFCEENSIANAIAMQCSDERPVENGHKRILGTIKISRAVKAKFPTIYQVADFY